mmetsp:Transcript_851/g.1972  ORF Transcript_851/g.1972 Transcript_851/m.1972 type:complete len:213 (-) Transcript_851:349-987(-)
MPPRLMLGYTICRPFKNHREGKKLGLDTILVGLELRHLANLSRTQEVTREGLVRIGNYPNVVRFHAILFPFLDDGLPVQVQSYAWRQVATFHRNVHGINRDECIRPKHSTLQSPKLVRAMKKPGRAGMAIVGRVGFNVSNRMVNSISLRRHGADRPPRHFFIISHDGSIKEAPPRLAIRIKGPSVPSAPLLLLCSIYRKIQSKSSRAWEVSV